MKKLLVVLTVLAFASALFGQAADNPRLTYTGSEFFSLEVHVYAYMVGIAYSLDHTAVYFDGDDEVGLRPIEFDTEPQVSGFGDGTDAPILQNDGGVRLDFTFWVVGDGAAGEDVSGLATLWDMLITTTTTGFWFPGVDEFRLYLAISSYNQTAVTALATPSQSWTDMITNTPVEATNVRFDHSIESKDAGGTGLNLVAFDPYYQHRDACSLWFCYWAPSSASIPGTNDLTTHQCVVEVRAELADTDIVQD
ncbi:hypothetical protein JXI42_00480 [bacterium]|nr:hypothetical protein [bacterium]